MRKYSLRSRLSVSGVDEAAGVIRGAVVALAGVPATGHFAYLHKDGKVNLDPEDAIEELPIHTDERFLETLLAAIERAGNKLKVRVDHDDAVESRVGYAIDFRRVPASAAAPLGAIISDIKVFETSKNRGIVFETAKENPENIGLSIDFFPSFEVRDGKAFFRADSISAVDIVDAGAVTPGGLFLSARDVDSESKDKSPTNMSENNEPKIADVLSAVTKLSESVAALTARMSKLEEKPTPTPPAEEQSDKLSAAVMKAVETALKQRDVEAAKFAAKLGLKPDGSALTASDEGFKQPEKTFEQLKADLQAADTKLTSVEAHRLAVRKYPDQHLAHLRRQGVAK